MRTVCNETFLFFITLITFWKYTNWFRIWAYISHNIIGNNFILKCMHRKKIWVLDNWSANESPDQVIYNQLYLLTFVMLIQYFLSCRATLNVYIFDSCVCYEGYVITLLYKAQDWQNCWEDGDCFSTFLLFGVQIPSL